MITECIRLRAEIILATADITKYLFIIRNDGVLIKNFNANLTRILVVLG